MIITNTSTSTVNAIISGNKVLSLKFGQSAIVDDKDGSLLLRLFPNALNAETVIEAEAQEIPVEPKPEAKPKAKRNVKSKKSGK